MWSALRTRSLEDAIAALGSSRSSLSADALSVSLHRLVDSSPADAASAVEVRELSSIFIVGGGEVRARNVLAGLAPLLRVAPTEMGRRASAATLFRALDVDGASSISMEAMAAVVESCLSVAELRAATHGKSSPRSSSSSSSSNMASVRNMRRARRARKVAESITAATRVSENDFVSWLVRLMSGGTAAASPQARRRAAMSRSPSRSMSRSPSPSRAFYATAHCVVESFFAAWLREEAPNVGYALPLPCETAALLDASASAKLAWLPQQRSEAWAVSFADTPYTTPAGVPVFLTVVMRVGSNAGHCVLAYTLRGAATDDAEGPGDDIVLEALACAMATPLVGGARRPARLHVAHRLRDAQPAIEGFLAGASVSTTMEELRDANNAAAASGTRPDGFNCSRTRAGAGDDEAAEEEWTVALCSTGIINPATGCDIVLIGVVVTHVSRDSPYSGCIVAFAMCDAGNATIGAAATCLRHAAAQPMLQAGPPRAPDRVCVAKPLHAAFFEVKNAAREMGSSASLTRSTVAEERLAPFCVAWAAQHGPTAAEEESAATRLQAIQRSRTAKREVERFRLQAEVKEEEHAALRLQSIQRGRAAQRATAQRRAAIAAIEEEEQGRAAMRLQAIQRGRTAQRAAAQRAVKLVAIEEAEQARAATQLQAIQRGRTAQRAAARRAPATRTEELRALAELRDIQRGLTEMRALSAEATSADDVAAAMEEAKAAGALAAGADERTDGLSPHRSLVSPESRAAIEAAEQAAIDEVEQTRAATRLQCIQRGRAEQRASAQRAAAIKEAEQARAATRLQSIQRGRSAQRDQRAAEQAASRRYNVRVNRHGSILIQPPSALPVLPVVPPPQLNPRDALNAVATFFDDVSLADLAQQLSNSAMWGNGEAMVNVDRFVYAMRSVAHVHESRSQTKEREKSCTPAALRIGALQLFEAMGSAGDAAGPLPLRIVVGSMAMVRLSLSRLCCSVRFRCFLTSCYFLHISFPPNHLDLRRRRRSGVQNHLRRI